MWGLPRKVRRSSVLPTLQPSAAGKSASIRLGSGLSTLRDRDSITMSITTWIKRDQHVVWHGFTQMSCYDTSTPVIVERGEGNYLYDVEGNRYLDAISSLWVMTIGHNDPDLNQAAIDQLRKISHSTMLGNGNVASIELAEALAPCVPVPDPHFLFASDGAAAVEQAIKIAFQYWHNQGVATRDTYLTLDEAYHGDTVGSLSVGAGGFGTSLFDPLRFPVIRTHGYNVHGWAEQAISAVEKHHHRLAAVVLEPLVQGAAGILVCDPDDVARLATVAQEHGVPVICDEVATGFGRTGTLFASDQCGIAPDIMCLGKGITGGYAPLSATAVAPHIYDSFLGPDLGERTFYHGHSYSGNALACAIASRHLQILEERDILSNVRNAACALAAALEPIESHDAVKAVRRCGLMVGVELDPPPGAERWGRRVCASTVQRGVLLRPLGDVVVIMPPLTITTLEVETIGRALLAAIDTVATQ